MVQLSHLYVTIGKTIALTIQIFVGKVMSLITSPPTIQKNVLELVMLAYYLTLCCPLLLLPLLFPNIRVFSNESALCIRWSKYWSSSSSVSPYTGDSGLIFFRIDGFDLLALQGTLKSLLQHHSSDASVL